MSFVGTMFIHIATGTVALDIVPSLRVVLDYAICVHGNDGMSNCIMGLTSRIQR